VSRFRQAAHELAQRIRFAIKIKANLGDHLLREPVEKALLEFERAADESGEQPLRCCYHFSKHTQCVLPFGHREDHLHPQDEKIFRKNKEEGRA
jgi:hypothetical protein